MTIKRLRTPTQASDYKGFAARPAGAGEDPGPDLPRPPVPNYPMPEHRRPRRRSRTAPLGLAAGTTAVVAAAGVIAYAVLRYEPAPVAPAAPPPRVAAVRPAPAPRIDALLRASAPAPGPLARAGPEAAFQVEPQPQTEPQAQAGPPPPTRRVAAGPSDARFAPRKAEQKGCEARPAGMRRLLCRQPQLAALDDRMNAAFADAVRSGAPAGPLAEEQEAWVIRRDRAARDAPDTVASLYEARIATLYELAQNR